MLQSGEDECESLTCRFELDEECISLDEDFSYVKNGESVSVALSDPDWLSMDWVIELHKLMKSHTGGTWYAFTISIGKDGKAKTEFEYISE